MKGRQKLEGMLFKKMVYWVFLYFSFMFLKTTMVWLNVKLRNLMDFKRSLHSSFISLADNLRYTKFLVKYFKMLLKILNYMLKKTYFFTARSFQKPLKHSCPLNVWEWSLHVLLIIQMKYSH